jgi:nicotinamidase-related amidase
VNNNHKFWGGARMGLGKNSNVTEDALIEREDCVLIIIDVQKKLLPFIANKDSMVENIVKLIKFAKIIDLPIIVTEQNNLGATVSEIANELQEIKPIRKDYYSCFSCSEFVERLTNLRRKTLILTGMETHICVAQTALQALHTEDTLHSNTLEPGFSIHVISDAVSSRFEHNWQVGIDRMRSNNAVISSTEMVIFELLRRAATDEFRATLPLVR